MKAILKKVQAYVPVAIHWHWTENESNYLIGYSNEFVTLQKDPQWDEHESTPAMNKKINLQRQEMKKLWSCGSNLFLK